MELKVIARTTEVGHEATLENLNRELYSLGGKMAGICYMPDDYFDSKIQNEERAIKRADNTAKSGHHSVFDHGSVTLLISDIPKIIAMILNSTQYYVTSEKSARYTKMHPATELEERLYFKWIEIFKGEIEKAYPDKGLAVEKLAMENARYLISVFTPTSMGYTVTYRQIMCLITWINDYTAWFNREYNTSAPVTRLREVAFYKRINTSLNEFKAKLLEQLGISNPDDIAIVDNKHNKGFEFLLDKTSSSIDYIKEYYGDVYTAKYKSSFAQLAQLQRHRTLKYRVSFSNTLRENITKQDIYIPRIIRDNRDLNEAWLADMQALVKEGVYPQGLLVDVVEQGNISDFFMKARERMCARAQLEIQESTSNLFKQFIKKENIDNLSYDNMVELMGWFGLGSNSENESENSVTEPQSLDHLEPRLKCRVAGYKCLEPCKFGGIQGATRKI